VGNTINGYSGSGATSVGTNRATQQSASREPSVSTTLNPQSEGGDQVQITSTASQLASLGAKLESLPAIDQGRVAKISQALADGTYSISADSIASGLLQSDRALGQIGIQES
jgi:negative regulator of flagellin synthesis FlgM